MGSLGLHPLGAVAIRQHTAHPTQALRLKDSETNPAGKVESLDAIRLSVDLSNSLGHSLNSHFAR